MKKRLFLTSMFAVMLACPAYAEWPYGYGVDPNVGQGQGYIGATTSSGGTSMTSAPCATSPLTDATDGSNNYGTYTLTAQWDVDECTILLDPNNGDAMDKGGVAGTDTGVAPYGNTNAHYAPHNPANKLYTTYNTGVYFDDGRTSACQLLTNSNPFLDTAGTNTSCRYVAPVGGTVVISLYPMNPNTTSNITITGVSGNSTGSGDDLRYSYSNGGQRYFIGFYGLDNNGDNNGAIDNNKLYVNGVYNSTNNSNDALYITQAGIDAAKAITKNADGTCPNITWKAKYSCPSMTLPTPIKPGYQFDGWYKESTYTTPQPSPYEGCTSTNLYAKWTANQHTITYDCSINGGTLKTGTFNPSFGATTTDAGTDNVTIGVNYTLRSPGDVCSKANNNTGSAWSCYWVDTDNNNAHVDVTVPAGTSEWNIDHDVICGTTYGSTTITYNCGTIDSTSVGGSVSGSPDSVFNGQTDYTIRSSAIGCTQLAGYHFTGWKCNDRLGSSDSGTQTSDNKYLYAVNTPNNHPETVYYTGGITIALTANTTCTAQWAENSVTVVYEDDNDPTNGEDTAHSIDYDGQTCQYGANGETFNVPNGNDAPTKKGYTFTGWKVTHWDE